ncbi:MAG TPA: polysaccharide deacetylase family protein, partial [Bacteroidales bacterium]|nr:polysaccharide deacetylase family protein [Bacteroidales bacterium]
MRSICLYFQVHQPYRLRTYRFFNIGQDHYYYDDYQNRHLIKRIAEKSYLPANNLILELIKEYGSAFNVAFSISGTALDQLEAHAPEVIRSFRQLADTGQVEFLAETYAHSLSSLSNREEFIRQVELHASRVEDLFGKRPSTFRNTELIYSDTIGETVAEMGYHTMLTEGAKHVLGWKSPNYMYCNNINPKLKVLLRNFRLSDDLSFRFSNQDWSEWPLTTDKFVSWLNKIDPKEEVVNLFLDYETIGEHQWKETGIFDFFRHLPAAVFSGTNFSFNTPEQIYHNLQPISAISVPYPISWADEERDLTAWLGNELQDEAFGKLYSYASKVQACKDPEILKDWLYLQTSSHFYYMCTKWFSAGEVHRYFNPYGTPYEAFINYMNVLSDFMIRVDESIAHADEPAEPAPVKKATPVNVVAAPTGPKTRKTSGKAVKKATVKKAPAKKVPAKKTPVQADAGKKVTAKKTAASSSTGKK